MGMTMYGRENTLEITLDQMIDHTKAVRRGRRKLGITDIQHRPTR